MLLFTAHIVAILSISLLAAGYLKADPKGSSARVFALMSVFIAFYLLDSLTEPYMAAAFRLDLSGWELLISAGVNTICGLFMLYCFLTFQEQQRFPRALAIAFAVQVLIDISMSALVLADSPTAEGAVFGWVSTTMDVVQLGFVGFAIYWTLKGWRADLVDDRRILRWFIIGVQGALIFAVVFVENFLLAEDSAETAAVQAMIIYAIASLALAMLLLALRFDYVSLGNVIRKVAELTEESGERGDAGLDEASFDRQFREGLLYREAGLTIAGLAKQLAVPEYRLRAFIHKQLGFRNFNAMLHQYRVEDASRALSDPENANVPVLTIALSVGYQSITPFNNAFRQLKGVTPSEFRKANGGGNGKSAKPSAQKNKKASKKDRDRGATLEKSSKATGAGNKLGDSSIPVGK